MKAMLSNSVDEVRSVLSDDPEAAQQPMWDDNVEPALCAAVRLKCSPEIIQLLLDNGADVNAQNLAGQNPLMIFRSYKRMVKFERALLGGSMLGVPGFHHRVEELLRAAQANTGIVEDEEEEHQLADMGYEGGTLATLAAAFPPMVDRLDLFDFLVRPIAFPPEPIPL